MLQRLSGSLWLFVICGTFLVANTQAQPTDADKLISQAQQIKSIFINEQISLDIYLPIEVSEPDKTFATMYVMDSQHYFLML